MKKHTLFFALFLFIFHACKKDNIKLNEKTIVNSSETTPETGSNTTMLDSGLRLESFPMPAEVEGCSCFFGESKEQYENENYVYVDDYGKNVYFRLNGKMIKIPAHEDGFEPENLNKHFENEAYKVTLTGKKINGMDEILVFRGRMTVENKKTGEQTSTPIYGECGC